MNVVTRQEYIDTFVALKLQYWCLYLEYLAPVEYI